MIGLEFFDYASISLIGMSGVPIDGQCFRARRGRQERACYRTGKKPGRPPPIHHFSSLGSFFAVSVAPSINRLIRAIIADLSSVTKWKLVQRAGIARDQRA
jgi:hypothetical protein